MKQRHRRQLLDWHIYLGLLFAPYFVLYGVSGIAFNHHLHGDPVVTNWERTLEARPQAASDLAAANATRDALGLGGPTSPWTVRRTADNSLAFQVTRPGRRYDISLSPNGELARVKETDRGWVSVVRELHGALATKGIAWTQLWRLYTEASVVALLFAVASGLLLWWPRKKQRAFGGAAIAGGAAIWIGLWSWLW